VCFHTFTRKFHPTGIVAGGTAAGAFSPAAALPFLEEIDEPSQSNPDGFASSPEGRALCAVRQSRSSSGEALAFRRQKKSSPLGGAGTAQAVTERVWT